MNTTTASPALTLDSTVLVRDVATNRTLVPMIGESTINLVGWVCALVYQDAEFRVYRVEGSSNLSLDGDGLAVGVRVYKYNRTISEWLLCCWTHVVANNPQMDEPFDAWFKRRTAEAPASKTSARPSYAPTARRPYTPAPSSYPSRTYTPAPVAKPAPDELDGMVGDVGKRVVTKL